MRRTALLLASMALAVLLASSVALAATIQCYGGRCEGTPRPDDINGSFGNDLIYAKAGNDSVLADFGNDTIYGGHDSDSLFGEQGDDTYYGNRGMDQIIDSGQSPDDDTMDGGVAADYLSGRGGNDTLIGGRGNEIIGNGESERGGVTLMLGGDGNDILRGGRGDDGLDGGLGSDRLFGGPNDDYIRAQDGEEDIVDCGGGYDRARVDAPRDFPIKNCEQVEQVNTGFNSAGIEATADAQEEEDVEQQALEAFEAKVAAQE